MDPHPKQELVEKLLAEGRQAEAGKVLQTWIKDGDQSPTPRHLYAVLRAQAGDYRTADEYLVEALRLDPQHFDSVYTMARLKMMVNDHTQALQYHDQAIELQPENPWARINRGVTRVALKDHWGSVEDFDVTIQLDPSISEAYFNKANALCELGLYEEAFSIVDQGLDRNPESTAGWICKGTILIELHQSEEALQCLQRAIDTDHSSSEAWRLAGLALLGQKREEEALISFNHAVELNPDSAIAWSNRGDVHVALNNYSDAVSDFQRAIAIAPSIPYGLGDLVHNRMKICDWNDFDKTLETLKTAILVNQHVCVPFVVLGLFDDPGLHRKLAENFYVSNYGRVRPKPFPPKKERNKKIRIGYFSSDFHNHATMYLLAEILECHDRERFEIYCFSFGPEKSDEMRGRCVRAVDQFFNLKNKSDKEIAFLSREHSIDIAVDLKGYTQGMRPGLFALRAAPIQIAFLGYPGTTAGESIDYIIADSVVIPPSQRPNYSESVIALPCSYQPNDSQRKISNKRTSRADHGLPEEGFVFACFNQHWKVLPDIFNLWMTILSDVSGSVLWLQGGNGAAVQNLKAVAQAAGVDQKRLVFAEFLPLDQHLARYRLVDLFLDTFPYGAHTTASDALWVGTPVLTMQGESFASRVAASLLRQVKLHDLIIGDAQSYRDKAVEIALSPARLREIRQHLALNKVSTPLFDAPLFTDHLQQAYELVYGRYQLGMQPEDLEI